MNINRDNYELFFLDYHEGNLTPEQAAAVVLFVEENPDLREDFEEFENIALEPETLVTYDGKESLKRTFVATANISEENYEDYLAAEVEQQLTQAETHELTAFMEQNPSLENERKLFAATILKADTSIVFPAKDKLVRPIVIPIASRFGGWRAAAAIVVLFGVAGWLTLQLGFGDNSGTGTTVAGKKGYTRSDWDADGAHPPMAQGQQAEGTLVASAAPWVDAINDAPVVVEEPTDNNAFLAQSEPVEVETVPTIEPEHIEPEPEQFAENKTNQDDSEGENKQDSEGKGEKQPEPIEILPEPIDLGDAVAANTVAPKAENEFPNWRDASRKWARKNALDEEVEQASNRKIRFADVLDGATRMLASRKVKVNKTYDDDQELVAYSVQVGKNFQFNPPVRKK